MPESDLLLPSGVRLVHIGPHKTGTTAIQGALRQARPTLKKHGVVYAGRERQHMFAALAITGGKGLAGDPPMEMRHWHRLVRQAKAAGDKRVVVSSEFFDGADDATARQVVEELGGPSVHIVVTLRPLAKIMPSAWQQYVRNRLRATYDEWLDAMLNKAPYKEPTPTFWQRHHHDEQVERWAKVVGVDRLTVVVVDETDRLMLLHTFEDMLGVPRGILEPETGWTNRSLSAGEIELIRRLNVEWKDRKWSPEAYKHFVRLGVVRQLQAARRPGPEEQQITTPRWALERAAEIGGQAAERISGLGVRIIGDISTLGTVLPAERTDEGPLVIDEMAVDAALQAVLGAVIVGGGATAAGAEGADAKPLAPTEPEDRPVKDVGTRELVGVLRERVRDKFSRR